MLADKMAGDELNIVARPHERGRGGKGKCGQGTRSRMTDLNANFEENSSKKDRRGEVSRYGRGTSRLSKRRNIMR